MASKKTTAMETLTLKPSECTQALRHMLPRKMSVFLWGPPGISKSSIIAQLAHEQGMQFIDIRLSQMDPTDLRGIPYPTEELIDGVMTKGMRWSAPFVLPRSPDAKAIILLDEFNSAPPSVQAGAYQLILDRKLGEYSVPEGCMIIAAGNRENDRGISFRMPTPIANRFVHLEMKADFDDWQRWALGANISSSVIGYLTAFKHELFVFDANSASRGFPTPRSWEFVSRTVVDSDSLPEMVRMSLVAGAIGEGAALKFMEYSKNAADLPNPRDILSGSTKTLKRADVSLCYALTTALCYELRDEWDKVVKGGTKQADRDTWMVQADNFLGFMMDNFQPEVTIMGAKTAMNPFKLKFEPRKMKNFAVFSAKFRDLILN